MKNDGEIIEALQGHACQLTAVEMAELLGRLTGGEPTERHVVMFFKRAFPAIPLGLLRDAGAWSRVSAGSMSDKEFNELLSPWLPQAKKEADPVGTDNDRAAPGRV